MSTPCTINQIHCEQCGSTSEENVGFAACQRNEGYSDCCNEIVKYDNRSCRNHHSNI